jgi:hypothetical protein
MSKILVCTNPFKEVERLVPYAILLGKHFGYSLKFLHIIDTREYVWYSSYADSHSFSDDMDHEALLEKERSTKRYKLQELILKYGSLIGAQPKIVNEVRIDMLEDALYENTREQDTSFLLITDDTGEGNRAYNLLTAIESSHCPVWIVPPEGVYKQVKKILFASDFKDYNQQIIKNVIDLATSYDAEIVVSGINISHKRELETTFFRKIIKALQDKIDKVSEIDNMSYSYNEINELSVQIHADLTVIHHKERNMLREMAWANAVEKVIKKNHPPLLIYKSIANVDREIF